MNKRRIYIDTSVFGGCFEPEFQEASRALLDEVRAGQTIAVLSDIVMDELAKAPEHVRALLDELPIDGVETLSFNDEANAMAEAYLEAKVVSRQSALDAQHVALATISKVTAIVSWNFKHIVNLRRMHGFNGVNMMKGYPPMDICTPKMVLIRYEEDERDA